MNAKKSVLILLCFVLVFAQANIALAAGQLTDISGHWAEEKLTSWGAKGIINGYEDGSYKPNNNITKAEFIKLLNNIIKPQGTEKLKFEDVDSSDWFGEAISQAVKNEYITENSGKFKPNTYITRQEVASIMCNVLLKNEEDNNSSALKKFVDASEIDEDNRDAMATMVKLGYINGYPDNTVRPNQGITRAETIVVLSNVLGEIYSSGSLKGSSSSVKTIEGNITVTSDKVKLENLKIEGNLYLAEGIGNGDITLENVTVEGETLVKGGGEHTITLNDCNLNQVTVGKNDDKVRLLADKKTKVKNTVLKSGAILEEKDVTSNGFNDVEVQTKGKVTLDGEFDEVDIKEEARIETRSKTVIKECSIDDKADNTQLKLDKNAKIGELKVDAKIELEGSGKIDKATIKENGEGSELAVKPKEFVVNKGTKLKMGSSTVNGTGKTVKQSTSSSKKSSSNNSSSGSNPTTPDVVTVNEIKILPNTIEAHAGDEKTIAVELKTSNGDTEYIWENVSNELTIQGNKVTISSEAGVGTYTATVKAKNIASNMRATLTINVVEKVNDTTPPAFKEGYPIIDNITKNRFNISVGINEDGVLFYKVLKAGVSAPTKEQLLASKTKLDMNGNGTYSTSVLNYEENGDEINLEPSTDYIVYMIAQDKNLESPNIQESITNIPVTTLDPNQPIVESISISPSERNAYPGETFTVDVDLRTSNGDKEVAWGTVGTDLMIVDNNITVNPNAEVGRTFTATVKAKNIESDKCALLIVTVIAKPEANEPPKFLDGYPKKNDALTTSTEITVDVKADKDAIVYLRILEGSDQGPSIDELFNATSTYLTLTKNVEDKYTFSEDLRPNTEYTVHMIARDKESKDIKQDEITKIKISTKRELSRAPELSDGYPKTVSITEKSIGVSMNTDIDAKVYYKHVLDGADKPTIEEIKADNNSRDVLADRGRQFKIGNDDELTPDTDYDIYFLICNLYDESVMQDDLIKVDAATRGELGPDEGRINAETAVIKGVKVTLLDPVDNHTDDMDKSEITITTAQSTDSSLATIFETVNPSDSIKVFKFPPNEGFWENPSRIYEDSQPILNNDLFILVVTLENDLKLYYKIKVTVE